MIARCLNNVARLRRSVADASGRACLEFARLISQVTVPKESPLKPISIAALLALLLAAPSVWARTCAVSIDGNDQMRFNQSTIKLAPDCTAVKLTLTHSGKLAAKVMGHNWVLTRSEDFQAVANAGLRARFEDSYLPPGDARVIAHTAIIGGGQTTSVTFATSKLRKGGAYTFFCSFPGHWALMKGTLSFA